MGRWSDLATRGRDVSLVTFVALMALPVVTWWETGLLWFGVFRWNAFWVGVGVAVLAPLVQYYHVTRHTEALIERGTRLRVPDPLLERLTSARRYDLPARTPVEERAELRRVARGCLFQSVFVVFAGLVVFGLYAKEGLL